MCSICLKNLPKNLTDLSTAVCRRVEHSKFFKQGFQWLTPSTSILRPTPYNVFKMSQKGQTYCNNHDYQSCHWIPWYECIFPHNQVEEMWWNQWQKKHINENSLTDVGKMFYIQFRESMYYTYMIHGMRGYIAPHYLYFIYTSNLPSIPSCNECQCCGNGYLNWELLMAAIKCTILSNCILIAAELFLLKYNNNSS